MLSQATVCWRATLFVVILYDKTMTIALLQNQHARQLKPISLNQQGAIVTTLFVITALRYRSVDCLSCKDECAGARTGL